MAISKSTPKFIQQGVKDTSAASIPVQQEAVPQNCPLYVFQAERGPITTQFGVGESMIKMYGSKTFEETEKFYSHQTAAAALTAGEGNLIATRRLVAPDAGAGIIAIGLEIVANDNTDYELNPDGSYRINVNGEKMALGTTTDGYLKRLVRFPNVNENNYRSLIPVAGTLNGNKGETSMIYPVMAYIADYGSYSSNVGLRLSAGTVNSPNPSDDYAMEDQQALLYRAQWVERSRANASPVVTNTRLLSEDVEFSFKRGFVNDRTGRTYDYTDITSAYELNEAGSVRVFGPAADSVYYTKHLDTALGLMFEKETAVTTSRIEAKEQINIFNDLGDADGAVYMAIQEAAADSSTISADGLSVNYFTGGADGEVSEDELDTIAADFFSGDWTDPDEPLEDHAQYPFSVVSDTGFALATKYTILDLMSKRFNIRVDVCTFIHNLPAHDLVTELSIGQSLQTRGLLHPESVYHGTQAFRFSVWGSEGIYTRSLFNRRVSSIMDILLKRARYAGAANGVMDSTKAYDHRDNNGVEVLRDVTHTYKTIDIKNAYWDLGVNYMQYRQRGELFWPAYQTGYTDGTSVLNGEIISGVLCDIKTKAAYHWAINTGDGKLTKEEFITRSDADFSTLVADKYDDRAIITGVTRFSADDDRGGFSWTLDINVATDPDRTVGQYNITVSRPDDA